MICKHCGAEMPDNIPYCKNCHEPLEAADGKPRKKGFLPLFLGLLVAAIALMAVLYFFSAPKIQTQPTDMTADQNSEIHYTIEATGIGLSYQWQIQVADGADWNDSTLKSGKTDSFYVKASEARDGYRYRCVVTDKLGRKKISDTVKLTVAYGDVEITAQPENVKAKDGDKVEFTIEATGRGLTYQWQIKTTEKGEWKDSSLQSGKTDTLYVEATKGRNGYQYRCVVTDADGNQVISEVAKLKVS